MTESKVVIITGMHRSGTSLVASLLQKAGVNIGHNLLGPSKGNTRGHFEDVDFLDFHDRILNRFGQTYFLQKYDSLGRTTTSEKEEALALIEHRRHLPLWGWKDPRTSVFLDFWHGLLPRARFLFIYRHPVEVVLSLIRRGVMEVISDPIAGLRFWEVYNQSILNFQQRYPDICWLGNISGFTADIEWAINKAGVKLDLPIKSDGANALYHASELRQASFSEEKGSIFRQLAPEAFELYLRLENAADLPYKTPQKAPDRETMALEALRQIVSDPALANGDRYDNTSRHFWLLLSIHDPQTVMAFKDDLERMQTARIRDLEAYASELEKKIGWIEGTKAWRLALKYYDLERFVSALLKGRFGGTSHGGNQ